MVANQKKSNRKESFDQYYAENPSVLHSYSSVPMDGSANAYDEKKDADLLKYNFSNEEKFKILDQLPIEIDSDNARFNDYIDTNEVKPYQILPASKIDRRRVVEVVFMSYGNIVGFEAIPLDAFYINRLYQFLPFDLIKLFPDEKDWVFCSAQGDLSYSVPNGWELLSDLQRPSIYHISKGSNQIIMRVTKRLAPLVAWNFWREREDFFGVLKKITFLLLPILVITLVEYPKELIVKEQEETVVLYKLKPPEPVVVATPEPTPVPTPEPTKVVDTKPTPKPTAPPKINKKIPPQPKVAKVPVQVDKTPPKRLVVKQGPVVVGGTGPVNPNAAKNNAAKARAKEIAQTKSKVSSALGFLAKSNGLVKVPATSSSSDRFMGGKGLAGAKTITGKNLLGAIVGENSAGSANGPINTLGSRTIASGQVISDGEIGGNGKSLNFVQGKVSVSGLHASGGSGSFGASMGQMSVKGSIDEDAVRAAIEKNMSKIRYCYEKSLLRKPSLQGGLKMTWQIRPGGSASGVSVASSALNDSTLHSCVSAAISKIAFPSPKGGPATVSYPFDFKPFQ